MGLSMFFALLNFSAVVAGILLLVGARPVIVNSLRGGFIVLVVALPLLFAGNIAQTPTFQSIVDETSKEIGSLGGGFMVWLSSLQPSIYPIGHSVAESLNFFAPGEDMK